MLFMQNLPPKNDIKSITQQFNQLSYAFLMEQRFSHSPLKFQGDWSPPTPLLWLLMLHGRSLSALILCSSPLPFLQVSFQLLPPHPQVYPSSPSLCILPYSILFSKCVCVKKIQFTTLCVRAPKPLLWCLLWFLQSVIILNIVVLVTRSNKSLLLLN